MTQSKSSSYILSQLTPVILSLSKDRVLVEDNLQNLTPVILSSTVILSMLSTVILSLSKERVLVEDNLRRFPPHFDKLSVTKENVKK